jgi:hypothetical protein
MASYYDGVPDELFPFRFFDAMRGRWVQARHKATRETIAATYERWEITGPGWTPSDVDGRHPSAGKPD